MFQENLELETIGKCSRMIDLLEEIEQRIVFKQRRKVYYPPRIRSKSSISVDIIENKDELEDRLEKLIDQLQSQQASFHYQEGKCGPKIYLQKRFKIKRKNTRESKTLNKINKIKDIIQNKTLNIYQVSKEAKCGFKFAKKIVRELESIDGLTPFHQIDDDEDLKDLIEEIDTILSVKPYYTSKEVLEVFKKQGRPSISGKMIRQLIRKTGRRWCSEKKIGIKKKGKLTKMRFIQLKEILGKLCPALADGATPITYIDEVKFVPTQNSSLMWRKTGHDKKKQNRVEKNHLKFICIAASTKEGFQMIQFYSQDIKSQDFQYFLGSLDARWRKMGIHSMNYLMDRASWHHKSYIEALGLANRVWFNASQTPTLNAIENLFSLIKARYRKTERLEGMAEEAYSIRNFFIGIEKSKLLGFEKNHAREVLRKLREAYQYELDEV